MLGKIFIGSVYNLSKANLSTRGRSFSQKQTMEVLLPLAYLPYSLLVLHLQDKIGNPRQ
jgi:hypothetical protein